MATKPSSQFPPKGGFKVQQAELEDIINEGDIKKITALLEKHTQLPWTQVLLTQAIDKGLELMTTGQGDSYLYNLIKFQQDMPLTEKHLKRLMDDFWDREFVYFYVLKDLDKTNNSASVNRKVTQRELFLLKKEQEVQIEPEDEKRYKIPKWMSDTEDTEDTDKSDN